MRQPTPRYAKDHTSTIDAQPTQPMQRVASAARKVPEITIFFWIVKILTTGMGETTSDYLVRAIDPYVAVTLGGVCFAAALALQLAARRYVAWVYWLAVVMVAIFGTMFADVMHVGFGVFHTGLSTAYVISTGIFGVALTLIILGWYTSEKTLSIHTITTRRRELFYWATVVTTFALGTAVGDMTATTLRLGYFASGLLFAVLFILPALGYWLLGLNDVLAFWAAYIVTRPLGASFADWLGRPQQYGGVGIGTGLISLILAAIIVIFVGYLTVTHRDTPTTSMRPPQ